MSRKRKLIIFLVIFGAAAGLCKAQWTNNLWIGENVFVPDELQGQVYLVKGMTLALILFIAYMAYWGITSFIPAVERMPRDRQETLGALMIAGFLVYAMAAGVATEFNNAFWHIHWGFTGEPVVDRYSDTYRMFKYEGFYTDPEGRQPTPIPRNIKPTPIPAPR